MLNLAKAFWKQFQDAKTAVANDANLKAVLDALETSWGELNWLVTQVK